MVTKSSKSLFWTPIELTPVKLAIQERVSFVNQRKPDVKSDKIRISNRSQIVVIDPAKRKVKGEDPLMAIEELKPIEIPTIPSPPSSRTVLQCHRKASH